MHGRPGLGNRTSYGIISPLVHGVTNIIDEADFDAERWYRSLKHKRSRSGNGTHRNPHADAIPGEPRSRFDFTISV